MSVRSTSAALAILAGAIVPAQAATWSICNRTPEPLQVAIAYRNQGGTWVSRGWWPLRACGGCAAVLDLSETDTVEQYYRAESGRGELRLDGPTRFCMNRNAFTVSNRGTCPPGFWAQGFHQVKVPYSDRHFTSTINPAPRGPVCTD